MVLHSKRAYIATQKCLFYRTKEPILRCKTMGIATC